MDRMQGTPHLLARSLVLLAIIGSQLLVACGPRQAEGPRDECGLIEPTAADVSYSLSFGETSFTSDEWLKTYTAEPYKINLTRNNDPLRAVNYLEYLIFNCGYGQADMDSYFSDESFDIIFAEYESRALKDFCEIPGLALYEYDLVDEGAAYSARYWVKQATETRLLVFMLVFPSSSPDVLDAYSAQIFPDLCACQVSLPQ